ncbi:BTB And Kelch [Ostertagia ostertagi]
MMRLLKPSNCLGIRAFADTYACQELLRCADKYISHNFQDVVGSEEFLQLSVDRLIEVISCEDLHVQSEEQVFAAVLEWIKFDLAARKQFLPRVLEHVRLSFCQPEFLVNTIGKDELVMTDVACRDFVDEAKAIGGAVNGEALSSVEKLDLRVANPSWVRVAPMSKKRFDSGTNQWSNDIRPTSMARAACGVATDYWHIYAVGGHNTVSCLEVVER